MFSISFDKTLTCDEIARTVKSSVPVSVSAASLARVKKTRQIIEAAVANKEVIYGVSTGFGAFKNTVIAPDKVQELQKNLICSHAVGVGRPFEPLVARTMMFLFINSISKGYSGVRPVVIRTLVDMYNRGVVPVIPEKGSVGSSGDLVPSAHLILVLIGQGKAWFGGQVMDGGTAMKKAGITPVVLEAKEGLALINNTSAMTANAVLALDDADIMADVADVCGALTAQAQRATVKAYDADIHRIRPHAGQVSVAARMRKLLPEYE